MIFSEHKKGKCTFFSNEAGEEAAPVLESEVQSLFCGTADGGSR